MSSVAAISPVGSVGSVSSSAAVYLPSIQFLQSQLVLYSQFATGTGAAAVDFKQLEYSIAMGRLADAQTELGHLRRDSEGANPVTYAPTGAAASANSTSGLSSGESTPPSGSIINTTA